MTGKDAYCELLTVNALDPTVFPSSMKLECEVVSMIISTLHGGPDVVGNFSSGGTESCFLAVKTARDWARGERKIARPEIVVPDSVHPAFHKAVANTCLYALCSVFLQLPLSLGLAMLLNSSLVKGRDFFRFSFFSPHLVGQVFVAVLFSAIFIPKFGLLNRVLHFLFGVAIDTKWLGDPGLVMPALVLTSLWMYVGFNMIYFLAALTKLRVLVISQMVNLK